MAAAAATEAGESLGFLAKMANLGDDALAGLSGAMDSTTGKIGQFSSTIKTLTGDITGFNQGLYSTLRMTGEGSSGIDALTAKVRGLSDSTVVSSEKLLGLNKEIQSNILASSLWGNNFSRLGKVISDEFGSEAVDTFKSIIEMGNKVPAVFDVIEGKAKLTTQTINQIMFAAGPTQALPALQEIQRVLDRQKGPLDYNLERLQSLDKAWASLGKTVSNITQSFGQGLAPMSSTALTGFSSGLSGATLPITGAANLLAKNAPGFEVMLGAAGSQYAIDRIAKDLLPKVIPRMRSQIETKLKEEFDEASRIAGMTGQGVDIRASEKAEKKYTEFMSKPATFGTKTRDFGLWGLQKFGEFGVPALAGGFGAYGVGGELVGEQTYASSGVKLEAGLGGVATGATAGLSVGGPWGMAVGAVIGGFLGVAGAANKASDNLIGLGQDAAMRKAKGEAAGEPVLSADYKSAQDYSKAVEMALHKAQEREKLANQPLGAFLPLMLGGNLGGAYGRSFSGGGAAKAYYHTQVDQLSKQSQDAEDREKAALANSPLEVYKTLSRMPGLLQGPQAYSEAQRSLFQYQSIGGVSVGEQQSQLQQVMKSQQTVLDTFINNLKDIGGLKGLEKRAENPEDIASQKLVQDFYALSGAVLESKKQLADFSVSIGKVSLEGITAAKNYHVYLESTSGNPGSAVSAVRHGVAAAQYDLTNQSRLAQQELINKGITIPTDIEKTLRNPEEIDRLVAGTHGAITTPQVIAKLKEILTYRQEIRKVAIQGADEELSKNTALNSAKGEGIESERKLAAAQGSNFVDQQRYTVRALEFMEKEKQYTIERLKNADKIGMGEIEKAQLQAKITGITASQTEIQKQMRLDVFEKWRDLLQSGAEQFKGSAEWAKINGASIEQQADILGQSILPRMQALAQLEKEINDPGLDINAREKLKAQYIAEQNQLLTEQRDITRNLYEGNIEKINHQKNITQAVLDIQESMYQPLSAQLPMKQKMIELDVKSSQETLKQLKWENENTQNKEKIAELSDKYVQQLAGISKSVSYIRNEWMQVLSEQALNLPNGTYTLPSNFSPYQMYGSGFFPFKRSEQRTAMGGGPGGYEYLHQGLMQQTFGMINEQHPMDVLRDSAKILDSSTQTFAGGMQKTVENFGEAVRLFAGAAKVYSGDVAPGKTGHEAMVGGALGYGGGKASGGSVGGRNYYLVGEKGPEYFVPNTPGTIIPMNYAGGRADGGFVSLGNNVYTTLRPDSPFDSSASGPINNAPSSNAIDDAVSSVFKRGASQAAKKAATNVVQNKIDDAVFNQLLKQGAKKAAVSRIGGALGRGGAALGEVGGIVGEILGGGVLASPAIFAADMAKRILEQENIQHEAESREMETFDVSSYINREAALRRQLLHDPNNANLQRQLTEVKAARSNIVSSAMQSRKGKKSYSSYYYDVELDQAMKANKSTIDKNWQSSPSVQSNQYNRNWQSGLSPSTILPTSDWGNILPRAGVTETVNNGNELITPTVASVGSNPAYASNYPKYNPSYADYRHAQQVAAYLAHDHYPSIDNMRPGTAGSSGLSGVPESYLDPSTLPGYKQYGVPNQHLQDHARATSQNRRLQALQHSFQDEFSYTAPQPATVPQQHINPAMAAPLARPQAVAPVGMAGSNMPSTQNASGCYVVGGKVVVGPNNLPLGSVTIALDITALQALIGNSMMALWNNG